ncbi:phosphosulfolactate synthase [Peribacillus kribbensis]|uniref:phosphosulfolactate synthase n=1 Tax=Peribacillus kribbensis TaxID=356658 RepID=UPI00047D7FBC|nr:phosphosulfolactate synthase [Peribacillus kribbensis]
MNMMNLSLPKRQAKPRRHGITVLIDNGVPLELFRDSIRSAADYIDYVKFGWGTCLVTPFLEEKMAVLREHDVHFFFGGTLFEKFLSQKKVDEFLNLCHGYHAAFIEISNGTLAISNREKARFIREFSKDFFVFSEVGSKDAQVSMEQDAAQWVEYIQEDLEAGAYKVITEARETGSSGICCSKGEIRDDIIEDILNSGINLKDVIFEAPNKKLQTCFIQRAGSDVNLANIPFADPISLETLRLGLRSDTFYTFEREGIK